jgi:hypothetical protein
MTEGQGRILGRIARLHPGLMLLVYFLTILIGTGVGGILEEAGSVMPVVINPLLLLFVQAYPLFVIAFLAGRFASLSTGRLTLPVAALVLLGVSGALLSLFRYLTLSGAVDVPVSLQQVLAVLAILAFVAWFYLWITASVKLVEAETGPNYSWLQVFGAFLLFFYLPFFGVYFLHRRIRRLVSDYENVDRVVLDLPMDRLAIAPMASGHLSLELTEQPNWGSFERYAEEFLRRLGGRAVEKGSAADMHLWNVEIEAVPLRLVYEDYPNRICLESASYPGDMLLKKLHRRLAPTAAGG